MNMKKYLIVFVLICQLAFAQPPYFPPAGSTFGNSLNSYGFPGSSPTAIMDCNSRTQSMETYYNGQGYTTQVGYQTTSSGSDHLYLFVKDPSTVGWAAVDPYFGYVSTPSYYSPTASYPTWSAFDSSRPRSAV